MRRIISFFLTIALAAGIYIPAASAAAGSTSGWGIGRSGTLEAAAELDNSVYKSGKASLKLSRKTPYKSNVYMNLEQSVPVEEGKTYQYSFWAKAKNINSISTLINWGARAYLNPLSKTYDWTYFSFKYTHIGASGYVAFKIIVDGPTTAFWVDDFEFCEYNDGVKGKNLLKNPGFEGDVETSSDSGAVSIVGDEFSLEDFNENVAAAKVIPVYKTNSVKIDGDVSDWAGATKLDLPKTKEQMQAYTTSQTDAKVSMSFAYDDKYFYFLTTAEDDIFFDKQGAEYWQGDSIQLCLSKEDVNFGTEIGYSYSDEGGGKYSLDFGEKQMDGLLLNTKRVGKTTYYESAIPWDLYYGGFMDEIKFCAIYNDNDGNGRKYAFQLSPGIAEGKVNDKFQTFRMIPENCDFFAWCEGADSCTVYEENEYTACILNNSDTDKEFTIKLGNDEKKVKIPAKSGRKAKFSYTFNDAGTQALDFSANDGESTQKFPKNVSVLATSDFYDSSTEELNGKAEEIKSLIKECNDKGISTDYENPAAFILERFVDYIKEDADRQYYDIMDYTFEELERIYTDTKSRLESYLSGAKESMTSPKFQTGDVIIDGTTHFADTKKFGSDEVEKRPVFFVGYGHFDEAAKDIPNFYDLGANTIQREFGVYNIVTDRNGIPGYSFKYKNFKCSYNIEKDKNVARSGTNYVKIVSETPMQSDCYTALYQGVTVEPNTTYEFGGKIKAENAKKFWMSLLEWPNDDNRNQLGGTYDWKDVSFEYTTPANTTSTIFQIFIEDTADEILLDDLYVRKKGTKTNLLKNNSFESKYEDFGDNKRISELNMSNITKVLKDAEENNVSMSLLLSPHYWPTAIIEDESLKGLSGSLMWMNVKSEEVKEVMAKYLEYLLPAAAKYKSLTNICITNEPTLISSNSDYYHDDFVEYLKGVYNNDLAEYNRINGTNLSDFSEIQMPKDTQPSVLLYDWKQFNDNLVYEWSSWAAEEVHKYLPDIPVHCKIMQNIYDDDAALRVHILYGSNIEKYAEFSDVHGCDAFNYYNPVKQAQMYGNNTNPTSTSALEKTMWYDLLTSIKYRPVYNTEDHIIADSSKRYDHNIAYHVGADIWQGALHGRGYTNIWVWSRKYYDEALANSILTRPDAIMEVSRSSLDLNRLSYEAAALANKNPDTALLWSDTSRIYQNAYANNLYKAYEASVYSGQKTGFVSENNIEKAYNHKVLICPDVVNIKEENARKLLDYAKSGRKLVLLDSDSLTRDEHNQPLDENLVRELHDNAQIIETVNDSFKMTSPENLQKLLSDIYDSLGMRRVRVVHAETGEDIKQVEYMYTEYNGKLLVNLNLYDWGEDVNIKILADGQEVQNSTELRSMTEQGNVVTLQTHQPILLEIGGTSYSEPNEIKLRIDDPILINGGFRRAIDVKNYSTAPIIQNDRTLLPVRAIAENIGGEAEWDDTARTATLKYNGREIKLTIDSDTAYIDGREEKLDSVPTISNDRIMLPLRFVAESFDLNVSWDGAARIVTVKK